MFRVVLMQPANAAAAATMIRMRIVKPPLSAVWNAANEGRLPDAGAFVEGFVDGPQGVISWTNSSRSIQQKPTELSATPKGRNSRRPTVIPPQV